MQKQKQLKKIYFKIIIFCRFQAGYSSCAQEAASFLLSTPGVDISVGQRLMAHLTSNIANPVASAVHSR
jgi:hypothetical protein